MTSMELLCSIGEVRTSYIRAAGENIVLKKRASLKYIWPIAAVIAALLLMGAALYTRWSRSMEETYHPAQEIKEHAQSSGLSVMLEDTKPVDGSVLTATDQGITVTAVQSIADEYGMAVVLRIEGFAQPEGANPHVWYKTTLDGADDFWTYWHDDFIDGISDPENMEFTMYYDFADQNRNASDRKVEINISALGIDVYEGKAETRREKLVSGEWNLSWVLSGSEEKRRFAPNTVVGADGAELTDVEIGPLTVRTTFRLEQYFAGWEMLEPFQPAPAGVRLKDGTFVLLTPWSEGYSDREKLIYYQELRSPGAILNVDEVEALAFYDGTEAESYVFVRLNR